MARRARKLRKNRVDEATRIAWNVLPACNAARGGFAAVDVSNHSDADQRHMVRSGDKRTIRRRTHIEKLRDHIQLEDCEVAACNWYADAHAARYDTLRVVGGYGDSVRSGGSGFDHLAHTVEQERAGVEFWFAREGITPPLRLMFDRIVLQGWRISPSVTTLFRLATRQLMHRIEPFVDCEN